MPLGSALWLRLITTALILLTGVALSGSAEAGHSPTTPAAITLRQLDRLLLDADMAGSRVVAVGERGSIVSSLDGGEHWTEIETPTSVTLTAVQFVNADLGWAVGHDSTILHSQDGGIHWQRQFVNPAAHAPLLDLHMRSPLKGLAVGAYGQLLRTDDSGRHWQPLSLGTDDRHIYGITWLNDERIVIVGESGLIAVSTSEGAQWRFVKSPYAGSLYGLLTWSDRVLIAYGMRGHILRSADAGETWQLVASPTQSFLFGGRLTRHGTIFLVGANGVLAASRNGGLDFSLIGTDTTNQLTGILPGRDNQLLLVGEQGPQLLSEPRR